MFVVILGPAGVGNGRNCSLPPPSISSSPAAKRALRRSPGVLPATYTSIGVTSVMTGAQTAADSALVTAHPMPASSQDRPTLATLASGSLHKTPARTDMGERSRSAAAA